MLTVLLSSVLALTPPVIKDEEQLLAHLCLGEPSPLDRLSRGGRLRLLENLRLGPWGSHSTYAPLVVDLTAEEKARIVDLLRMEAYRDGPEAQRSVSAGYDSHGYPAPDSDYCAGAASLGQWARMARARDEGELATVVARFVEHTRELMSEGAAFEQTSPAIRAAAEPTLRLVDEVGWAGDASDWVLRDTVSQTGFAAELSEDPTLIEVAMRVRRVAAEKAGIDGHDDALVALREKLQMRVPGKRRIGRLEPSGSLLIETVEAPPSFILVSSAGCGFSRNLLNQVAENDDLADLARRHLTVLAPGSEFSAASDVYERWNATHPAVPYRAWILRSEWPEINLDSTPVLYEITGDGARKLFHGFPSDEAEERLDTLRAALSAADARRD
jgi:hypothetical protein